jgi:hypothetical protein
MSSQYFTILQINTRYPYMMHVIQQRYGLKYNLHLVYFLSMRCNETGMRQGMGQHPKAIFALTCVNHMVGGIII